MMPRYTDGPDWMDTELTTGTTIMAAEYDGGVIVAADSRTTSGSYVANRVTDKLTKITDQIYCCRSGSAADTQAIADIVKYQLEFYRAEMDQEPLVETAARIFKELIYNNRSSLSAAVIVAGWDKRKGGQVYVINLGGMVIRKKIAIGGSGSSYIYGFVDSNYKENMTREACVDFTTRAVSLAMSRDGSSGGVVRVGILGATAGLEIERLVVKGKDLPY